LLCKGHGNNGKDALREVIRLLYGEVGMSHATVSDFAAYDGGRKFCLSKLEGSRINWSSENSRFNNLDSIQSLKLIRGFCHAAKERRVNEKRCGRGR